MAEKRLRQFTAKDPSGLLEDLILLIVYNQFRLGFGHEFYSIFTCLASLQRIASPKTEVEGPALARKARSMREGIVKGRAIFQMFLTLTGFSRMLLNYFAKKQAKQ